MTSFIDRHRITFPSIVDREGDVFARYGVPYQPAWVFIARDGSWVAVQGSLDRESLAPYVEELIAQSA